MANIQSRHLSILFTDIKGFTDRTSNSSRTDIQKLIDDYRLTVLPVMEQRGGKLVKTIGDAFLMIFESPTDAVLAGVAAQEALARRNAEVPESDRIEIRVAINAGDVNLVQDDVYGEAVNIASRIEGMAEAGEVYFTEAVYLAMNKTEVPSSEVGLLQLKGIPEKVRVYKVRKETPLGVGQVPDRQSARAAVPSFAPGEKARMVGGVSGPPAPRGRRAAAVILDFLICSMLVSMLVSAGTPRSDGESVDVLGKDEVAITDADGSKIHVKGDRVTIREARSRRRNRAQDGGSMSLAWVLYNFAFIALMGATPGKKALRLKVVDMTGAPADWKRAGVRALMSLISGTVLGLGYLWGFWSKEGRTWHDAAADTRVIPA